MAFVQTLVFRNVTSANWSTQATAIIIQSFLEFKYFICVMIVKPCRVIHLILDKTWSYVFELLIFLSVEPSVKVHESKNRKTVFSFNSQDLNFWCSTLTKWVALCKICFIGCWGTLLLGLFPGQWCAPMCMFLVLLQCQLYTL